jgi:hypothetical protein
VQVLVVTRHGARTPASRKRCWDGYGETVSWECGGGGEVTHPSPTRKGPAARAHSPPSMVFQKVSGVGRRAACSPALLCAGVRAHRRSLARADMWPKRQLESWLAPHETGALPRDCSQCQAPRGQQAPGVHVPVAWAAALLLLPLLPLLLLLQSRVALCRRQVYGGNGGGGGAGGSGKGGNELPGTCSVGGMLEEGHEQMHRSGQLLRQVSARRLCT